MLNESETVKPSDLKRLRYRLGLCMHVIVRPGIWKLLVSTRDSLLLVIVAETHRDTLRQPFVFPHAYSHSGVTSCELQPKSAPSFLFRSLALGPSYVDHPS